MNSSSIKYNAENYSIEKLKQAENALLNEETLSIEIEGKDEGEKLTHVLAAIFCKQEMLKSEISINQAIRLFFKRVRNSIN
ncbi:MAG: hypothetical protein HQ463_08235 [Bacteroidetes bacterium]|nr:hypothetical protein [Bacteroidota bacterium]